MDDHDTVSQRQLPDRFTYPGRQHSVPAGLTSHQQGLKTARIQIKQVGLVAQGTQGSYHPSRNGV